MRKRKRKRERRQRHKGRSQKRTRRGADLPPCELTVTAEQDRLFNDDGPCDDTTR